MTSGCGPIKGRSLAILGTIVAAFLIIRLPVVCRQPGGQDEEYYAFPGLTIVDGGIPRMPHVPQRDPDRVFYNADKAFFAEPPLYFYVQAAFYAVLTDVYGTARLPSLLAGVISIVMVYVLARRWYRDEAIALWSAGLYSLLRMFYFTAIAARPDLFCTAWGLLAIYAFDRWRTDRKRSWFVASGLLIGLGGLTHPFAIIYATQLAVWAAWSERGWRRLTMPCLLAAIAIATCALWLPLIAAYPQEFRVQFGNNILRPTGPGLLARFLSPWAALAHQTEIAWERAGLIQFCLLTAGLVVAAAIDGPHHDDRRKPVLFAVSAICLISMFVGEHPAHGYWSFAAVFLSMCLSRVLLLSWRRLMPSASHNVWISLPAGALVVLALVPGLGLRATWAYLTHWNELDYNAPRFAKSIMDDLPTDARYTVGTEYVLDFYASGRETLIGETSEFYLKSQNFPYDYLVLSHDGIRADLARIMNGRLLRTYGNPEDPFACYAEVYVPREQPE